MFYIAYVEIGDNQGKVIFIDTKPISEEFIATFPNAKVYQSDKLPSGYIFSLDEIIN